MKRKILIALAMLCFVVSPLPSQDTSNPEKSKLNGTWILKESFEDGRSTKLDREAKRGEIQALHPDTKLMLSDTYMEIKIKNGQIRIIRTAKVQTPAGEVSLPMTDDKYDLKAPTIVRTPNGKSYKYTATFVDDVLTLEQHEIETDNLKTKTIYIMDPKLKKLTVTETGEITICSNSPSGPIELGSPIQTGVPTNNQGCSDIKELKYNYDKY